VFRKYVGKSAGRIVLPLQHLPNGVFYIEMIYDGGRSVARRIVKR